MIMVIGGNLTPKLIRWLKDLEITKFDHITIRISDISEIGMKESAERLREWISPMASIIISVGPVADKLLTSLYILHGSLPPTSTKNKKEIDAAFVQCKNYLISRRFYVNQPPNNPIS